MQTDVVEIEKDREAARYLDSILDGRRLPPFLPGEPNDVGALIAAARNAPDALAELGRIYSVKEWDADAFERIVLKRALNAWHSGLDVGRSGHDIVITSRNCPVTIERELDARVCQSCRAFHALVALNAAPDVVKEVKYTHARSAGDGTCRAVFTLGQ